MNGAHLGGGTASGSAIASSLTSDDKVRASSASTIADADDAASAVRCARRLVWRRWRRRWRRWRWRGARRPGQGVQSLLDEHGADALGHRAFFHAVRHVRQHQRRFVVRNTARAHKRGSIADLTRNGDCSSAGGIINDNKLLQENCALVGRLSPPQPAPQPSASTSTAFGSFTGTTAAATIAAAGFVGGGERERNLHV